MPPDKQKAAPNGDLSRDSCPGTSPDSSRPAKASAQQFARPKLSLAYAAPSWKWGLIGWPAARRRPKIRTIGNVSFLDTSPVGFRLVESADGWSLAWWMPRRHKASRCAPFSEAGTLDQAAGALAWLLQRERRPVYPPLTMERAAWCKRSGHRLRKSA